MHRLFLAIYKSFMEVLLDSSFRNFTVTKEACLRSVMNLVMYCRIYLVCYRIINRGVKLDYIYRDAGKAAP